MAGNARLRVGLKYCGHCQPYRNMVELVEMIRLAAPDLEFVRWSEPDVDVLLLLQACRSLCAEAPPVDAPVVEVAVSSLDFAEYETDEALVQAVLHAIRRAGDLS